MKNTSLGLASLARIFFAGVMSLYANAVLSNEGFYQGAGSTLQLTKNSHLRVREENLLIRPIMPPECYSVYADGKAIENGKGQITDSAKITLGGHSKCNGPTTAIFKAKWRATAEYEIEVLQTQRDVLIGFPVDTWRRDFVAADGDLYYLYAPSVANFHTYMNSVEIEHLELVKLRGHDSKTGSKDELGYRWTATFEKGTSYHLLTKYDFGGDTSNAFYKGREFLAGETPWFLGVMPEPFTAERIIYFLTPINSWAPPPPEQIKIEVQLPTEIPVTYFVPLELKPTCVASKALHYLLKNQFPSHELSLSMPNTGWWNRDKLKPLRTLKQWNKWQRSLGGESVKISCDVIEELKKTAAPDLQAHMRTLQCVSTCGE